jgi:small subunit ribosomal protein S4
MALEKSKCKLCRRENTKLFLKGSRCLTDKCSFERRPYPPGQHGQSRLKFSEFALQLREKQKTKRYYGISEKQFRKSFAIADRAKEVTGLALLRNLELRLDNVCYLLGLGSSRREARQVVFHGHVTVNGKSVTVPSFILKKGDSVKLKTTSADLLKFKTLKENPSSKTLPSWLSFDLANLSGQVLDAPSRDEVTLPVEENMIVEYYSR